MSNGPWNRDFSLPRTPEFFDQGGGSSQFYPDLHERQIEALRQLRLNREERLRAHIERVAVHLRRYSRAKSARQKGRKRATWCVELRRKFASLSAAGRFVGRPPSNIFQAIRKQQRCGPFHWTFYDQADDQ